MDDMDKEENFGDRFGEILGLLLFGFAFIMEYPVMWLWNYTMPSMVGLPEIDFNHAIALKYFVPQHY